MSTVATRYRTIHGTCPHPEDVRTIHKIMELESHQVGEQLPVVWNRAEGSQIEALVKDGLVERSAALGAQLAGWLTEWQSRFRERIPLILGQGLLWAVYICESNSNRLDADLTDRIIELAWQRGVFSIRTGCGTVKLGPPLNIEADALKEAVDVYIVDLPKVRDANFGVLPKSAAGIHYVPLDHVSARLRYLGPEQS